MPRVHLHRAPARDGRFLYVEPQYSLVRTTAGVRRQLEQFDVEGESRHTPSASTLQVVLDHCHQNDIPYRLRSDPVHGYHVQRLQPEQVRDLEATSRGTSLAQAALNAQEPVDVVFVPGAGVAVGLDKTPEVEERERPFGMAARAGPRVK